MRPAYVCSARRLYRATHGTFEDYCVSRWGMKRNYANRLVAAADAVRSLPPEMVPIVTTESQAREIAAVPAPERAAVVEKAIHATGGKITAAASARRCGRGRCSPGTTQLVDQTALLAINQLSICWKTVNNEVKSRSLPSKPMKITLELTPAQVQDLTPWASLMETTPARIVHALAMDHLRCLYEGTSDFGDDLANLRECLEIHVESGKGAAEHASETSAQIERLHLLRRIGASIRRASHPVGRSRSSRVPATHHGKRGAR